MAEATNQQADGTAASAPRGFWRHLLGFDSWLHSAASLSLVTVIAGWFGTYIQYLSSYEQKVGTTAQADMGDATRTFLEISNAYGEAQMLQQLIYFNFAASAGADAGDRAMTATAAQNVYQDYVKARNTLRKTSNIDVRKAELYIDWPSNLDRDPAGTAANDGDPLTESLLGAYNFDCDASDNFPHYEPVDSGGELDRVKLDFCRAPNETRKQAAMGPQTVFCAVDDHGKIDHARPSREIHWYSAKHHLIVMHYCFETTHSQIETARIWASGNAVGEPQKEAFLKNRATYQDSLDHEVIRLDAFLNLVMSELERIRVKYRPSGFYCSLPLVGAIIGDRCLPVRIANGRP